ncbi:MAG TPA: ferritin family protein [Chloroflexota bacterium]|nr:ferritin family protein [Chloroflexota bacterium]
MMSMPLDRAAERDVLATWAAPEVGLPAATEPAETPLDHLLAAFEHHIASEADTVTAYRELSESTADPVVALLLRQVVDDEERHHALLRSMASRLRDTLRWTHSPDALPTRGTPSYAEAVERAGTLRELARQEREGARQARDLAKAQAGLYDGLFGLLLDTMAADSEKHERILSFVARRMEARRADA